MVLRRNTADPVGQVSWVRRAVGAAVAVATVSTLALEPAVGAEAAPPGLPLGDPGLPETRSRQVLARGVTLTTIVRGSGLAPPDRIQTTTRGPWVVRVLTINPDVASGRLRATYGRYLATTSRTSALVRSAGAVAGVNGSYFAFTGDRAYPGDPAGLGLYNGGLLSEPSGRRAEVDLLVGARGRVRTSRTTWSGTMRNRRTGRTLLLDFLNHRPVVPLGCATLKNQALCQNAGDTVLLRPRFSAATPAGVGDEVVLGPRGCVVRRSRVRGTTLGPRQTSLQATGRDVVALRGVTARGCLSRHLVLTDEAGDRVALRRGVHGVNGRYRLTRDGDVVAPHGSGSFFARNPRTLAGRTAAGRIKLVTIDGRQRRSVGTTMPETAAVAQALNLRDSVNLDGGGSTTMSVRGRVVNRPSDGSERAVADALVYVP